jgi:integrase
VPRFTQMTGLRALALAAGMPVKAISEMLGHSTPAFTADVNTEVAEELVDAAASAIAAYALRRGKIAPGAIFCAIRRPG